MKAFPSNGFYERTTGGEQPQKLEPIMGMDLRDYFAIHFAQSQIELIKDEQFDALETFKTSYKLADIMMKAREQ
jgi:hypothetical protein